LQMFAKFKFGNGIYEVVGGQSDRIDNTPLTFVAEFLECLHENAVFWNPYNEVVQCHRCGEQFEPKRECDCNKDDIKDLCAELTALSQQNDKLLGRIIRLEAKVKEGE
jgi:hypothetical protein